MKTNFFWFFLGLVFLIHNSLYSQTYFSKRFDFNGNLDPDFSGDILIKGAGYIVFTGAVNEISYYHYRLGFLNIDSLGNPIGDYKVYEDSVYSLAMGFPGSFISNQNVLGYYITGFQMKYVPTGRWDRGMLWRFDNNLDTLWTKTYSDDPPHDTSFLFRNFRPLPDGGFIIVGSHGLVDGTAPIRINLHRVDSLGNLIWRKYYGSGYTHFLPYDVSRTSDDGFIVGAAIDPIDPNNAQDADPYLIKTDSIGNFQWSRHLGNPDCCEEWTTVDLAADGNIVCGTIYSDTCYGSIDHFSKINFVKIDNSNNIIWDKKYGIHKFWLRFNKIRTLENGDIIATGSYDYYNDITGYEVSWILKTDSAGNELWYREYMLLTATFSQNILYNVIPTPDNGFIACGTVWPYPPDTGTQDSWVLKVDSLGCEAPNQCWVGQEEIWVKTFTPEKPFIVYPNPATDKLTLEFHINPEGAELELYNLTGKMVLHSRVPRERDLFEWDIGRLGRGMYILKVNMPGRRAVMEKVVVE